ncbi:MAG: glycosyltransferase [Planctomycetota bacterium]
MQPPLRASIVVCTYEQSRELDLALAAIARQSRLPDEVLIADDGSGDATAAVIDEWNARTPFPIHRVWQEDRGYRKSRIVNEAVRRAEGDHLIFLDGDSFPHPAWVEDHMAAANGRSVLCGRRVKLGPALSPTITRAHIEGGRFDSALSSLLVRSRLAGDTKRLGLAFRFPRPIARLLHPRPRKLMGVNFSLPKTAFAAVNGYDETWQIYGHEDRDLELRLIRAGIPRFPLLNRAVVYHLHHEERERTEETMRLLAAAEAADAKRCARGYDLVGAFDPHG